TAHTAIFTLSLHDALPILPFRAVLPKRRKWLRRLVTLILIIVSALMFGSIYQAVASRYDAQAFPPPGKLIEVGGHRLHIYCTGRSEEHTSELQSLAYLVCR